MLSVRTLVSTGLSLSVNLSEEPLHARQVLIVVTDQVVNEGSEREGTVLRECALASQLFSRDTFEEEQRVSSGSAEGPEGILRVG